MTDEVIYRVLGNLEVGRHGTSVTLPSGRALVVLAALLVNPGHLLTQTELVRVAWGEDAVTDDQLPRSVPQLHKAINQIRGVLEEARRKLTRQEVRKDWPPDHAAPAEVTLWRWLERAVAEGKVRRAGKGRRHSPFRYWLPEAEARWQRSGWSLPELPDLDGPAGAGADEPLLPPGLRTQDGEGK